MPRHRRRAYPTDLTDEQWAAIADLVPGAHPGGRPRRASSRELVNAILYGLRGGQAWRLLPHDFPPWQTVYYYLRRWQVEGVWERTATWASRSWLRGSAHHCTTPCRFHQTPHEPCPPHLHQQFPPR
jgi:transposase